MKKTMTLFLALVLALGLVGCGAGAPDETPEAATEVNVYVLAGPTGIGALPLWAKADGGGEDLQNVYHVTMTGANDEIVAAISGGSADIACVATNMAAALYNKTGGGVKVLAVNTLGVLSILTNGAEVSAVADLKGKTVYSPGQGANPEYVLRYVLQGNGLDPEGDVEIRFVGEGSELLSVWQTEPDAVILAPQPVATTLQMQYEGAKAVLDMTEEWDKIAGDESTLMMGCVIVRTAFLEEHPAAVEGFLRDYAESIKTAQEDVEGTAALCEAYGIIPKAALAAKAIPHCGLTYVAGEEMRRQLGGYLAVMFDAEPKSVGGAIPGNDFYYGA